MTRKPRRPVLDPVIPDTPTLAGFAHHRHRAAQYQATRLAALNTPVPSTLSLRRIAGENFPIAWKRTAVRQRAERRLRTRLAAIEMGRMAFALRDLSLRYSLTSRPTLPPAA